MLEGTSLLCGDGELQRLNHATTVATNALLERRGGRVAFVTTEGFRDLLYLGRGDRRELYSIKPSRVEPPLREQDCFSLQERIASDGSVLCKLEESSIISVLEQLDDETEAVALCLLHSCLNPEHENRFMEALKDRSLPVFASHQVAPSIGEYERATTTVLAAYLSPKVRDYLQHLESQVGSEKLRIVHSSGGLLRCEEAKQAPHRLALSGPAAGLRGALEVGRSCQVTELVTLDMGGTSTDVALIADGELPYCWETELAGLPLRAPSLEIHTVGAGGGSIASRDSRGLLQVGPRSAGSVPGPACYGRGGTQATVTDALFWNGFLPETLGNSKFLLQRDKTEVVLKKLAQELGIELVALVDGILDLATAHLANACRKVTTGRGENPENFTLFCFGGAGPLMACRVAEALQMKRILIPSKAGVLSAWGALCAPWEQEWSRLIPAHQRFQTSFEEIFTEVRRAAECELGSVDDVTWSRFVMRRYQGQGETLVSTPERDFHALHKQRFGFARADTDVETLEIRLRARQKGLKNLSLEAGGEASQLLGHRQLRWKNETLEVPLWQGEEPPSSAQGPYLHISASATCFVAPGWKSELREGHLHLEKEENS